MLDTTIGTQFLPGTNLKGDMVSADWRFLLPNMELDSIVCFGTPKSSTITVLTKMSQQVLILGESDEKYNNHSFPETSFNGISKVRTYATKTITELPLNDKVIDLFLIDSRKDLRNFISSQENLTALARLMKPGGVIYFKLSGLVDHFLNEKAMNAFEKYGFGKPRSFWLGPVIGRIRAAIPLDDGETRYHYLEHTKFGRSYKDTILKGLGKNVRFLSKSSHYSKIE